MRKARRILAWVAGVLVVVAVTGGLWLHFWFRPGESESVGRQGVEVVDTAPAATPGQPDADHLVWQECLAALENAQRLLDARPQAKGRFRKQERLGGRLGPVTVIESKQRLTPLSVYLRWVDPYEGRECVYQEGLRDGKMVAHEGGALGRISPTVLMKTDGNLALQFSNHPLPDLTVWRLNQQAVAHVRKWRDDPALRATRSQVLVRKQPAVLYELVHPGAAAAFGYRRLAVFVSQETALPLRWELHLPDPAGQPDADQLLEYIEFDPPDFSPNLTDADFDPANAAYKFGTGRPLDAGG